MSLLDEARAQARLPGPICNVQKAMAEHPKLAAEIAEAVSARDVSQLAIGRAFAQRGIDITGSTVQRHRSGACAYCRSIGVTW